MIRAAIVAPSPALRVGLRAMLDGPTLKVVADSPHTTALASDWELADVLILTGESWREELPADGSANQDIALVVLADDDSAAAALRDMALKGWAVVPPDSSATQLEAAVMAAGSGLTVLPVAAASSFYGRPGARPVHTETTPLEEPLTARELEVLQLLSEGLSNKLIAKRLTISEHTVKFHVSATYAKLGAASRTEAVSQAARRGLISL